MLPPPETLAVFVVAAVALVVTPGPDTLFVLTQGLTDRERGVLAALGVATGVLVHTTAVALGLAALLRTVPLAFDAVTYAGAAYLLVLGVRTARRDPGVDGAGTEDVAQAVESRAGSVESSVGPVESRAGSDESTAGPRAATSSARADGYRRGVLVNVLNPKVALFFLAFLPSFAASAAGMVALGGLYAAITAGYLSAVALAADRASDLFRSPEARCWLNRVAAAALCGLAVLVAVGR